MPYHVVTSTAAALNTQRKSLNGANVLILGVAYKRDIDDLRESPSLTIIELLQKEGARSAITIRSLSMLDAAANTTWR